MNTLFVFLAVAVATVYSACDQQKIVNDCSKYADKSKELAMAEEKDIKAMCKVNVDYMKCITDSGCAEEGVYKTAVEQMNEVMKQMKCASCVSTPSLVTIFLTVFAVIFYK